MRQAFLLTRHAQDTPQGIQLELWFSTADGPLQVYITRQRCTAFIRQRERDTIEQLLSQQPHLAKHIEIKSIQLKDFSFESMAALYCNSISMFYRLRELFAQQQIDLFEADIRPTERYLSERFITAPVSIDASSKQKTLYNPRIKATHYSPMLRLMSFDIETAYDTQQLFSIAYICEQQRQVLMIGDDSHGTAADTPTRYLANERELLQAFIDDVQRLDPDVLTGWNVVNFDFQFLQKKADQLKLPLRLGRNHSLPRWRQSQTDASQYFLAIPGRAVLDGIDTLKSATWQFPSFSLENVANELLGRGKLIKSSAADSDDAAHIKDPLYKAKEIKRQFNEDKPALAKYNLQDCQLVLDIFARAELLHFAIERATLTGLEMDRVGGSVAAFDNLYLPRLHRRGFTAPNIGDYGQGNSAPGGYVMSSRPGLYYSVLVLDYKSLYPSIIRTFRVDPYARIAAIDLPENETIAGYDGASFAKQQHILPGIITELWQARDRAKQENNSALSQAIKIIMNSFYGVLGTPGCRVHDSRLTSSITKRSHDIIKQSVTLINQQGYEVIYGDTDSVFVSLDAAVDEQTAERIGKQLTQSINQHWQDYMRTEFDCESYLEMEYETHFSRFFMPTIRGSEQGSKKRYAGVVKRSGKSKLVFKGLENVRTDWTRLARDFQYQLYQKVFNDEAYDDYIRELVSQLKLGHYDKDLVYRKRLRQPLSAYTRNVPPHARAALKAEDYFSKHNLPSRYRNKGWIEYVITLNGPEAVECQSARLDYDHYIERQLLPVADSILGVLNDSIHNILDRQISLF